MTAMIRALLWKEWHEQRWKLVFGCAILMAYMAISLRARLWPDFVTVISGLFGGAVLWAVFTAMGTVAPERADGSLGVLLARPIRPWWVLAVKTVVAVCVSAGPIAAGTLVALLVAAGREVSSSELLVVFAVAVAMNVTLLIWTMSIGIRCTSEAQVTMVGMVIIAAGLAAASLLGDILDLRLQPWACGFYPLWIVGAVRKQDGLLIADETFVLAIGIEIAVAAAWWMLAGILISRTRRGRG